MVTCIRKASGGGGGAAGAGVGGHTDVTAADVYRDLVKVVKALSKCEAGENSTRDDDIVREQYTSTHLAIF